MVDRLNDLLNEREFLYGMLCRDATLVDVELMAQAGYHIIWIDLEHSINPLLRHYCCVVSLHIWEWCPWCASWSPHELMCSV